MKKLLLLLVVMVLVGGCGRVKESYSGDGLIYIHSTSGVPSPMLYTTSD